ncbi:MAG: hypothetical protein ACKPKO_02210, partial [Candidatus Fonsibacter sp.]
MNVRAVRRRGEEGARWHDGTVSIMRGTPWEPVPGREGTEVRSRVVLPEVTKAVPAAREYTCEERVRRRPNIEKRDV